jgi:hypothetical protein
MKGREEVDIPDADAIDSSEKEAPENIQGVKDTGLNLSCEAFSAIGVGIPGREIAFVQGAGEFVEIRIGLVQVVLLYAKRVFPGEDHRVQQDGRGVYQEQVDA